MRKDSIFVPLKTDLPSAIMPGLTSFTLMNFAGSKRIAAGALPAKTIEAAAHSAAFLRDCFMGMLRFTGDFRMRTSARQLQDGRTP
jgi:hypothetical protein